MDRCTALALCALLAAGCGGRERDDDDTTGDGDSDADGDGDGDADADGDGDADGDADGDRPCEQSPYWQHEAIAGPDDPAAGPIFSSVAVDGAGGVHVCFTQGGALWYANDAASWILESVTAEGGVQQTSIAISPDDTPVIAYFAEPPRDLVVARRGEAWSSERVDETGNVGWGPSLAFAADGEGHVVYGSTEQGLRHAVLGGLLETIDPGAEGASGGALAIGGSGTLYALGRTWDGAVGRLLYAERAVDDWDVTSVATAWSVGADPAIAVDADGVVRVAAVENDTSVLHLLQHGGDDWLDLVVDPQGGQSPVLAVDADGGLHIVYFWYGGGDLRYARLLGGEWEAETIASAGDVGQYPAIAIGPDGTLHVVYSSFEDGSLMHASRSTSGLVGPSPACQGDAGDE